MKTHKRSICFFKQLCSFLLNVPKAFYHFCFSNLKWESSKSFSWVHGLESAPGNRAKPCASVGANYLHGTHYVRTCSCFFVMSPAWFPIPIARPKWRDLNLYALWNLAPLIAAWMHPSPSDPKRVALGPPGAPARMCFRRARDKSRNLALAGQAAEAAVNCWTVAVA